MRCSKDNERNTVAVEERGTAGVKGESAGDGGRGSQRAPIRDGRAHLAGPTTTRAAFKCPPREQWRGADRWVSRGRGGGGAITHDTRQVWGPYLVKALWQHLFLLLDDVMKTLSPSLTISTFITQA